MGAPLYSTITLFAELFISTIVYYTIYQGYTHNKFPAKLAFFALAYEIVFNISYMVSQVGNHVKAAHLQSLPVVILGATHGILSLIMFIALVIFFIVAWRKYKKEVNYFQSHKILTYTFLVFWTFSVVSGILLYLLSYGI